MCAGAQYVNGTKGFPGCLQSSSHDNAEQMPAGASSSIRSTGSHFLGSGGTMGLYKPSSPAPRTRPGHGSSPFFDELWATVHE